MYIEERTVEFPFIIFIRYIVSLNQMLLPL